MLKKAVERQQEICLGKFKIYTVNKSLRKDDEFLVKRKINLDFIDWKLVKFRSLDFNVFDQMLNLLERVRINYLFFRDYKRGFSFGKGNFINYKIFSRISKVKKFTTTPFQ